MVRRKCPRGSLPVHADLALAGPDGMPLHLGDVVADVVHEPHSELAGADPEHALENLADLVEHDLTIAPRVVGGATHGPQVRRPLAGIDRRGRQLDVREPVAVLAELRTDPLQIVVADLIAEPARTGVDHDDDLILGQAEPVRPALIEDPGHTLDLEEVVSRPQRPDL